MTIERFIVEGFVSADLVGVAAEPRGELMMHGLVPFPVSAGGMSPDMPPGARERAEMGGDKMPAGMAGLPRRAGRIEKVGSMRIPARSANRRACQCAGGV